MVSPAAQTNTGTISDADQFDPNTANNTASATETPQQADLSVTKTVSDATPNVGDQITFTVTLSNQGPDAATGVQVTDLLPAGLTFVSATPSQGTYNNVSGVWTVGTVSSGVPQTLSITATVVSPAAQTNTGTISDADQFDPNTANNTASATETPQQADLAVTKTVSDATPNVGDQITFTVTLSNQGPDAATGVQVTDLLPAGVTLRVGQPQPGHLRQHHRPLGRRRGQPGAPHDADDHCHGGQPRRADQHRDHQRRRPVRPEHGQQHRQRHRDAPAGRPGCGQDGEQPDAQRGRPDHLHRHAVQSGPRRRHGGAGDRPVAGRRELRVGQSQPGQLRQRHRAVGRRRGQRRRRRDAGDHGDGGQRRRADQHGDHHGRRPVRPEHRQQHRQRRPRRRSRPTWLLTKTVSDATPNVGDQITFTVTLANKGPDAATGVQVTDLLPAGVSFVSANPGQGTYDSTTGLWDVGTVANGAQTTLTITATVVSPAAQTNTGTISDADQFDPNTANNTASATETPQQADLSVTKTVSDATPNVGDQITFTVTLSNQGPDAATGVQVTDLLPAGLTFVGATPSQGTYNNVSGVWTVGTVSSGVPQTLSITALVVSPAAQTNTGTISDADQFDPNTANNTASATVIAAPDMPGVAQNDAFTTAENAVLNGVSNVFADNGSGPDSDPDDPLQVTAVNGNALSVGTTITLASGALLTLNANGTFSYDPNGAFDALPTPASGASNTPAPTASPTRSPAAAPQP